MLRRLATSRVGLSCLHAAAASLMRTQLNNTQLGVRGLVHAPTRGLFGKARKEAEAAAAEANKARQERRLDSTIKEGDEIPEDTGAIPEHYFRDETLLTAEQEHVLNERERSEAAAAEAYRKRLFFYRVLIVLCGVVGLSMPALLLYANKDKLGFQWQFFPVLMAKPEIHSLSDPAVFSAACDDALRAVLPHLDDAAAQSLLAAYHEARTAGTPVPAPPASTDMAAGLSELLGYPYVGPDAQAPVLAPPRPEDAYILLSVRDVLDVAQRVMERPRVVAEALIPPLLLEISERRPEFDVSRSTAIGGQFEGILARGENEVLAAAAEVTAALSRGFVRSALAGVDGGHVARLDASAPRPPTLSREELGTQRGGMMSATAGAGVPLVSYAGLRAALAVMEAARCTRAKSALAEATSVWGADSPAQDAEKTRQSQEARALADAIKDIQGRRRTACAAV
jgi:hypothetical protein